MSYKMLHLVRPLQRRPQVTDNILQKFVSRSIKESEQEVKVI